MKLKATYVLFAIHRIYGKY